MPFFVGILVLFALALLFILIYFKETNKGKLDTAKANVENAETDVQVSKLTKKAKKTLNKLNK